MPVADVERPPPAVPSTGTHARGSLDHINIRCLLDGRKFRISTKHGSANASMSEMSIGFLHRRLAEQTGFDASCFALYLGGPRAPPDGRQLHFDDVIDSLSYVSSTSHHLTVLLEMRPWSGSVPPPSAEGSNRDHHSHRRPPPPTAPQALSSRYSPPSLHVDRTHPSPLDTATRGRDVTPEPSVVMGKAAPYESLPQFMSSEEAQHVIDELQYQLEVASALLTEDRQVWADELAAFESAERKRASAANRAADRFESEAAAKMSQLLGEIEALTATLTAARRRSSSVNESRGEAQKVVDGLALEFDELRFHMLDKLQTCGAGEQKDADMVDKLIAAVSQKHLRDVETEIAMADLRSIAADLDAAKYQRRVVHNAVEDVKGNIRVVARMRPRIAEDLSAPHHPARDEEGSIVFDERENNVRLSSAVTGNHEYEFFRVYGPPADGHLDSARHEQQRLIFLEQVQPLLQSVFDGQNVSVIAYGQTGSGKTHTIFGDRLDEESQNAFGDDTNLSGILPQAVKHIFTLRDEIEATKAQSISSGASDCQIVLSMVEVYMNDVYDVLAPCEASQETPAWGNRAAGSTTASKLAPPLRKCDVRASGSGAATVHGATELVVTSAADALSAVSRGFTNRTTHRTLTNSRSSRSHLILSLQLRFDSQHQGRAIPTSTLMFVDLAGSERVHRSLSAGDRLREAQHINRSLSALGDVLGALTAPGGSQSHVPYRNSKLTHLLQQCVGGDCRTLLIACVCPHVPQRHNLNESASTLAFAARARHVRNRKRSSKAVAE